MVEAVVAGAMEHGCTSDEAVHLFRGIWYYTVGEILVRAHSDARRPPDQTFFSSLDPAQVPRLAGIGNRWPALAAQDTYLDGLGAFVDGLLSRAARPTP